MKTFIFYEIDGGDKTPELIGYAANEPTAKRIAKGEGFWGGDASVSKRVINAYESVDEYENALRLKNEERLNAEKEQALAKLSSHEKEILGL